MCEQSGSIQLTSHVSVIPRAGTCSGRIPLKTVLSLLSAILGRNWELINMDIVSQTCLFLIQADATIALPSSFIQIIPISDFWYRSAIVKYLINCMLQQGVWCTSLLCGRRWYEKTGLEAILKFSKSASILHFIKLSSSLMLHLSHWLQNAINFLQKLSLSQISYLSMAKPSGTTIDSHVTTSVSTFMVQPFEQ